MRLLRATSASALALLAFPALAQSPDPAATAPKAATPSGDEEILVTARRRDESSIATPVVLTAVTGVQLERRGITTLDALAQIVPQVMIGSNNGAVQGGTVTIRGISGPDANPFGDQAVSFNIDGMQIAKSSVRRLSQMDIQQIEILKGPQALFFGKNSPAGIISIRTADPGPRFDAKASVGYEFEGREKRGEGYVSTPLSDTVGLRVAGYVSDGNGYIRNEIPDGAYLGGTKRTPVWRDYAIRGTLKFEPTADLVARLKVAYGYSKSTGINETVQLTDCPYGAPQLGMAVDCKANDRGVNTDVGTTLAARDARFGNGKPYIRQKQWLSSLELVYQLADALSLTSATGFYDTDYKSSQNAENNYVTALPYVSPYKDREFSQEFRFVSSYDGPINFTGGVYYSTTKSSTGAHTFLMGAEPESPFYAICPPTAPCPINNYFLKQKGDAYSAYLQLSYKPVPTVEITAGGRYSYEKKRLPLVQDGTGIGTPSPLGFAVSDVLDASTIRHPAVDKGHWNDFSPEVTLAWRPNDALTFFGSYKHGFLSGGFNAGTADFTQDLTYRPQTIKGFEGGAKMLIGNALRLNLAAYTYRVSDLQATSYLNNVATIRNAGGVKVQGVEFDFNYRTPLPGFSVHGAGAYNRGRYTSFQGAPCYTGQTAASGCTLQGGMTVPTQDLTGTELLRAPKWNLSAGAMYDQPIGGDLKLTALADATHSTSYLTDLASAPRGRHPRYTLIDASLRLGDDQDVWQVALVGRNLTNRFVYTASYAVPFTGSTPTGLPANDPAARDSDRFASTGRGRELFLQLSYRFGS